MLLFIPALTSSACTFTHSLTDSVSFHRFDLNTDETMCIRNISARTSLLFGYFDRLVIQARHTQTVLRSGGGFVAGFDSGNFDSELEILAANGGKFSYFAVKFPEDCEKRIVSGRRIGILTRTHTKEKVCYFTGGHKVVSYDVQLSANASGKLTGPGFELTGNMYRRVVNAEASVIRWEGEVNFVAIGILGEWNDDGWGIERELNGSEPSFIVLDGEERRPGRASGPRGEVRGPPPRAGPPRPGPPGERPGGRGPPPGDEWEDATPFLCLELVELIVGIVAVCGVVQVVKWCRRKRQTGQQIEGDYAVPPIAVGYQSQQDISSGSL
jgi:hypothetical protein